MRTLGSRRAARIAGAAVLAAVTLAGCSAGLVAETSRKRPSNQGLNESNSNSTVLIRNLSVIYPGSAGYAAGSSAALELGLYNQTTSDVRVTVASSPPASSPPAGVVWGNSVGLVGPTSAKPSEEPSVVPFAEPSGSVPSSVPSGAPDKPNAAPAIAQINLPPHGHVTFQPGDATTLQVIGLSGKLLPGTAVSLTFTFDNGAEPLTVKAPMGIPLTPASRAPAIKGEHAEGE